MISADPPRFPPSDPECVQKEVSDIIHIERGRKVCTMKLACGTMRDVIMSDTNGAKLKGISSPTQVMVVVLEIWDNIVIHPKTTLEERKVGEGVVSHCLLEY